MKPSQLVTLTGVLIFHSLGSTCQGATVVNRWSFDIDTTDSVGGNTGVLTDATVDKGQLVLTGIGVGPNGNRMTFTNPIGIGPNFGGMDDEGVTLETWYTDTGTGTWGKLFQFGRDEAGFEVGFTHARGGALPESGIDRDGAKGFGELVAPNEEHHLVITVSVDGNMNAWVDGEKKVTNSDTNDLSNVGTEFEALGATSWGDPGMTGTINEFRIWSGNLTDFEVSQNLASGPDLIPTAEDTDGDGLDDAWELAQTGVTELTQLTGLVAGPGPGAGTGDFDGDGLSDLAEFGEGTDGGNEDSDDDGLTDGQEVNEHKSDPLKEDTDGDTLSDGAEVNIHGSSPLLKDTDMDFYDDPTEVANGTDPADAEDPGAFTGTQLVHRWSFTTGAEQLTDSAGGNSAVPFGSPDFTDNKIVLDGLVIGPDADSFGFTRLVDIGKNFGPTGVSIESWYTDDGTGGWAKLVAFGDGQQDNNILFNLQRSTDNVTGVQYTPFDFTNGTRPSLNEEHHLALTITPSGVVNAWIDGVHMNSANESLPLGDGNDLNTIGNTFERVGGSAWSDAGMLGSVNEFRIWRGNFTAENVAENFASGPDLLVGEGSLAIDSIKRNSVTGAVTLVFKSVAGRIYRIDRSPDLLPADSPDWADVDDAFVATTNLSTFTDNTASGVRLFYRVQDVTK